MTLFWKGLIFLNETYIEILFYNQAAFFFRSVQSNVCYNMIHNTYNILGTDWNSSSHNNHGGGKNYVSSVRIPPPQKKAKGGGKGEESSTFTKIL